ncbi:hypothetical protein APUTEX25_000770 [Auxenochlorella protothecoides]|uniref:GST N-terminal domain-containing protein n=1 Tax=Auxenochlorella protothecoides TaxID=3075 RepID=A0A3M7KQ32_AUXPR|nr:hypothetical protein APUTEX25_000770 [Auxenochlorella protothecoides]|eukprot:RMZ52651.1 hypothetical protein APUTEX25_000770 [Auxenochlorella protothecoides]
MRAAETTARPPTTVPSWSDLESGVERAREQLSFPEPDYENGPANSYALEEKRIPYTIEKINMQCYGDKPAEFLAKVPSGLLPVLEVGGRVFTESAVIQEVLEQLYPEIPLLPQPGTQEHGRAAGLMRLERRLFSDWLQWLCRGGWNVQGNRRAFCKTMEAVDDALRATPGPFFLESGLSLVDLTFAPFLERIAASMVYYKGFVVRGQGRWPGIDAWFEAMEARDSYRGFKSDYYTHCHDLPPQLGGCTSERGSEEAAAAIDGGAWRLPLQPLAADYAYEAHSPGDDPERDALTAAARLVSNRAAVVPFALRGASQGARRTARAHLSDPGRPSAQDPDGAVDAALRCVAGALLSGTETAAAPVAPSEQAADTVRQSLSYMRDRICVPRDLPLPAARQLRAHLNWAINGLIMHGSA